MISSYYRDILFCSILFITSHHFVSTCFFRKRISALMLRWIDQRSEFSIIILIWKYIIVNKLGQYMISQNSVHIWFLQRLWVTLLPLNGPDCQKVVYEAIHKNLKTAANTSLPQNRLRGPGLDFCTNMEIKKQSIYNRQLTL